MLINVEKENIIVKSKVTGRKYKVYKINIEHNKVADYMIYNQGKMEFWDAKRFYELGTTSCCTTCPCCPIIKKCER